MEPGSLRHRHLDAEAEVSKHKVTKSTAGGNPPQADCRRRLTALFLCPRLLDYDCVYHSPHRRGSGHPHRSQLRRLRQRSPDRRPGPVPAAHLGRARRIGVRGAEGRLRIGQAFHRPILELSDQGRSVGLRRFLHSPTPGSGDPAGAHTGDRPPSHSRYDPGYRNRSASGHNLCGKTRHLPGPDLQGIRHFWHGCSAILGCHHADHSFCRLLGLAAGLWTRRYDGMVPHVVPDSQYAGPPDFAGLRASAGDNCRYHAPGPLRHAGSAGQRLREICPGEGDERPGGHLETRRSQRSHPGNHLWRHQPGRPAQRLRGGGSGFRLARRGAHAAGGRSIQQFPPG